MKHLSPILVSLLAMAPLGSAWAEETCGDTICGKGYVCEQTEVSACPAIACAPDSECDILCEPKVSAYCKPAPCTSDDQCGDGMVCHTTSYQTCQGATSPACESGRDCGDLPVDGANDVACTEHTVSQCTPTWQLPCTSDESCGEGFSCVERESCGCSGSAPSSGGGGGSVDPEPAVDLVAPEPAPDEPTGADGAPPVREECSCAPTGEFHCAMNHIDCEVDADCPENWRCQVSSSGTCWADSEGNRGCDESETRQCVPRAFDVAVDSRGELTSSNGNAPDATTGQVNDGAQPPQGNAGAGDQALPESAGAVEPTSKQAAGCSVASGVGGVGAAGGMAALLALAVGAVFGRRRDRTRVS